MELNRFKRYPQRPLDVDFHSPDRVGSTRAHKFSNNMLTPVGVETVNAPVVVNTGRAPARQRVVHLLVGFALGSFFGFLMIFLVRFSVPDAVSQTIYA